MSCRTLGGIHDGIPGGISGRIPAVICVETTEEISGIIPGRISRGLFGDIFVCICGSILGGNSGEFTREISRVILEETVLV